jgi:hypothetical protein
MSNIERVQAQATQAVKSAQGSPGQTIPFLSNTVCFTRGVMPGAPANFPPHNAYFELHGYHRSRLFFTISAESAVAYLMDCAVEEIAHMKESDPAAYQRLAAAFGLQ